MDFFNTFSTIKSEKNKKIEKTKPQILNTGLKRPPSLGNIDDPHATKIVKFGTLTQETAGMKYNQNIHSQNFDPPTPLFSSNQYVHTTPSHSFSCHTPTIRPGIVSLSKTMDSPLRAICQTPVHLSNNSKHGFILPSSTITKSNPPSKIVEAQQDDLPDRTPLKQDLNKPASKSIPTIRLTNGSNRQPISTNPLININTTANPKIITLDRPHSTASDVPPKVICSKPKTILRIPSNNGKKFHGKNSSVDSNGENLLDIFSFPSNNMKAIPTEFENDISEFAEYTHNEAYSNYEPAKYKFGKSHPYVVVESRSLSSTNAPDITYELKLPQIIINKGILSNVQLEAVVYACQKHEEKLFDDTRLGFLIGDGAGVGKGRTIGGIIYENYLSGRKKAVWVSVSGDLKQDAERDLGDIGNPIKVKIKVAALNKMTYNAIESEENGKFVDGVLFVTYSSLISKCKNAERNKFEKRLDQIIHWFGTDYDGVIVFDECHKAKNLHQNNKTKTGSIVKKLQDKLKFARVVYASATGASEPKHMAYMARLGLWGPGKSFSDFEEFEQTLTSLGVGAMELIAIEMKKNGIYLARQLSFKKLKFEIREMTIENSTINGHKFKDVYNKCVVVWNDIYKEFHLAFKRNKFEEKDDSNFEAQFWSAHQRFFKYLCIASKIEECVKISKYQVEEKQNCVVIGLQSTGEARTKDLLDETGGDHECFVSSAKGVVENLIKNHYPSMRMLEKNKAKRNIKFIKGNDVEGFSNTVGLASKHMENCVDFSHDDDDGEQRMLKSVEKIDSMFPLNALDQLIHGLGGPDHVAEMTGRKGRMVEKHGVISYQLRKKEDHGIDQTNIIEKDLFNSGKKYFAIISDAASTGISLHSDKRFENKRKRFHITLELPWSADKAIQQFGRTHRSNQVNGPHYMFLISDLAGERRFAATVAKRLESLGALTHGDRRCADSRDFSQFNIDNDIGSKAVHNLITSVISHEPQVVAFPEKHLRFYKNSSNAFKKAAEESLTSVGLRNVKVVTVTKFLNRILGMELDMQNALFQYFLDIMEYESQKAKLRNEFDHGIRDIMNDNDNLYVMESHTFKTDSQYENDDIVVNKIQNTNGISWDSVFDKYKNNSAKRSFYVSKSSANSSVQLLAFAEYKADGMYSLMRPNFPGKDIEKDLLNELWEKTQPDDIQTDWKYIYEESKDKCIHEIFNTNCNYRDCTNGKRTKINYLITGAILMALKKIYSANVNKKLEIIRVQLFDKSKLIGALVPQPYYKVVMNALETGYNVPHVQQFSINLPESSKEIPITEEVTDSKVTQTRKRKPKNTSTPVNLDYARINDIIRSQLVRSEKSKQPDTSVAEIKTPVDRKEIIKRKLIIKKESTTEEKKKTWKDIEFPNVIINFISEEDFE